MKIKHNLKIFLCINLNENFMVDDCFDGTQSEANKVNGNDES